ncbi:DUF5667 domain-containing protein [Couchioplanes azureus]|uniref:DUF5667 domain-containing protein n=1 Tax=Couchioplanes caeruleus TaxID=56438 RepID=UPI00166FE156|nr:DUF5667 domain-containing protein [Couchioplanes caeruleus]GGQ42029.1 hypothetical protein GCM10010166_07250 [Couchioplanes caeruleus subsp. azureus]
MKFDFFDRRSAERFAELLDETHRRHHARGQVDDEQLAELVAIGHRLSAARTGAQVDPEFRVGLRAMLVATAERDGIGETATAPTPEPDVAEPARKLFGLAGRRIRARGAIVIGVAAGAMAVSGISAASENAAPGDALYGVKRSTERAQLAMAGSDVTRGQLSLTFARNRLTEAAEMDGDDPKFRDALDDMDADTKQGVKLLNSAAVTRRDASGLASVDSFVDRQRRVLTSVQGRLNPANRERAARSLTLLDLVQQRTENLRDGLGCDTVTQAGSDALGPKLRSCRAGASDSSAAERRQGQAQGEKTPDSGDKKSGKQRPGGEAPAEPGSGDQAGTPAGDPSAPSGNGVLVDPAPVVSEDPLNPPTGDKGLLGDLLGGIFDSD